MQTLDMEQLKQHPHRRFNPLMQEWVLVSPNRNQRPWLGQVETPSPEVLPAYDPECYLCPGNTRAGGARNPQYRSTFVFDNDFAALLPTSPQLELQTDSLLRAETERGICRVLCFHPRHDLALGDMQLSEIRSVVDLWTEQYLELGREDWIRSVLIFENRGTLMGASNPHPHGQVWANASIPNVPAREERSLTEYQVAHGTCMLCRYLELELSLKARVVIESDHFVVLVPFWAVWPFETLVLSRRHLPSLEQLSSAERDGLAAAIKSLTAGYDRVFEIPFPYSMGFHQKPTDGTPHPEWHLHAHYLPPLLRSATVRKFMVGYEMLGTPQRDITPEQAAERLRDSIG